jgi:soluble lytic murein transglycosylase-like protein
VLVLDTVFPRPSIAASLLAACLLCMPAAHALEHVTLANGFSYDCTRHEADGDQIRLFYSADSYQDFPAKAIRSIEPLPGPPPAPRPADTIAAQPSPSADIHKLLATAGAAVDIDVALLSAVIHAESGGRIRAVSRAGAEGLMQLMPSTAAQLGVHDAFRPEDNIHGGAAYLNALLNRYDPRDDANGLALALAAYNAGPGAVDRYHGIPPFRETRAYVARVMREYARRKAEASRAPLSAH